MGCCSAACPKLYVAGRKSPPVCTVCDAGIVHLHHAERLSEQKGEEDEGSENVKKT